MITGSNSSDQPLRRLVTFENEEGGAIRNVKRKEPIRNEKIMEALAAQSVRGGAIRKARRREPKRDKKLEQALASKKGGRIRFHDSNHKYLYEKLSGRGDDWIRRSVDVWSTKSWTNTTQPYSNRT